jgi:Fe-S cluster biosynthesis and repair protein YggX
MLYKYINEKAKLRWQEQLFMLTYELNLSEVDPNDKKVFSHQVRASWFARRFARRQKRATTSKIVLVTF